MIYESFDQEKHFVPFLLRRAHARRVSFFVAIFSVPSEVSVAKKSSSLCALVSLW